MHKSATVKYRFPSDFFPFPKQKESNTLPPIPNSSPVPKNKLNKGNKILSAAIASAPSPFPIIIVSANTYIDVTIVALTDGSR